MNYSSRSVRGMLFGIAVIVLCCVFLPTNLHSQVKKTTYPDKTINITQPWVAGNNIDLFFRGISPQVSKKLGVPIEFISKPGGSGIVGTHAVMSAAPDGYTLLADCPGSSSMQMALSPKGELPYKVEERTFIASLVYAKSVFVVSTATNWKTLTDIEQAIRKDPASFRWPYCGTSHMELAMGQFKAALTSRGVDLSRTKTVPFQGSSQVLVAIAGNHADFYVSGTSGVEPLVRAGKLRPIAVAYNKRCKLFPEVETTAEQGFPSVAIKFWIGVSGPAGLPESVVQKLCDAFGTTLDDPDVVSLLDKLELERDYIPRDEFKKYVISEAKEIKTILGK